MTGRRIISWRSHRVGLEGLLLFLVALALLLMVHRYNLWDMTEGWVIADEGHQAYQPLRWLAGQMYFRDFATDNYPPGVVLWNALLFRLFGARLSVLRVYLAVVGAGIAAGAYLLARAVLPAGAALFAYGLCLTWNVPYLNIAFPSWACVMLGLLALGALWRYQRRPHPAWLVLAGALCGLSALFKLTQGAYQWLGLALFLAWRGTAGRSVGGRRVLSIEGLWALVCLAAGGILLAGHPTPANLIVFGLPLLLASVSVWTARPARELPAGGIPFLGELLWLILGAVLVTLAWAIPTLLVVGWPSFLEQTLLGPWRRSALMQAAVRPLTPNAWLMLAWAGIGALAGWKARRLPWQGYILYGLAGAVLWFIPWHGDWTLQGALRAGLQAWSGLRFYLPALVSAGLWLALVLGRRNVQDAAWTAMLLSYGAWNLLQVYPFADANHLLWSIQPAFIGLAWLGYQGWRLWQGKGRGAGRRRAWLALAMTPAVLAALQLYPIVGHFYRFEGGLARVSYELLDEKRADVYVRADAARTLREVAGAIEARTTANDVIFDTSGAFFYFLTGRHNPTRHDYFWPSFLTREEVEQLVQDLESHPPALVIGRQTEEPVFGYASFAQTYPEVAAFIEAHYHPDVQIGEYILWSRK
ncbi:MAG: hypothetical protein ACUVWB_08590 [Anaerolineae bacterium]